MKPLIKILNVTLIIFTLLFALPGCGPMYNSSYTFQSPHSWDGKQCVNQCLEKRSNCKMQCNRQNQQCMNSARLTALPAYMAYTANKEEQDKHPHKTVEDFANYSGCDSSCGCEESYNQCFSNCGGVITEHRQCVAFCDKVPPSQLVQSKRVYQ